MNVVARKKIVLLGMMTKIPVAGAVWGTMQYLIGLRRLGYDAYYVEAHSGTPTMLMERDDDDSSAKACQFLEPLMRRFGFADRWAFHALHDDGRCYGMSESQLQVLYRSAALLINYHAGTLPLPEHRATDRLVCLETDPVELEIELYNKDRQAIAFMEAHAAFFTWGLNYNQPDCRVPLPARFPFMPSCPAIVPDLWHVDSAPGNGQDRLGNPGCFTTVGNWRQGGRVRFQGQTYTWSKHDEFLKFLDLPRRTSQRFELALSGYEEQDKRLLEANGWQVCHAMDFSTDLDAYRNYVAHSRGEFTVAKDQNVRLRSGWFSERSAQYLAAGLPVITQDTGFGNVLPTGEGLFAFSTMDDVLAAVDAINTDYRKHSRAAADIAREHFSYDVVLRKLLAHMGLETGWRHVSSVQAADAAAGVVADAPSSELEPCRHETGVNFVGYLRTESGVGAAGRGYIRALRTMPLELSLFDISDLQCNRALDRTLASLGGPPLQDVNLVCADVEVHFAILSRLGETFFEGRHNIGIWAWEQPVFPRRWHDRFAFYDEIWVGSSFIANALAPVCPLPVVRIPPVLTVDRPGCRESGRKRLGVEADEFIFLFVFDFHSHTERKNPLAVIQAFQKAFRPGERARLVLKCVNAQAKPEDFAQLTDRARGHAVTLYSGYWPGREVQDLMAACDAYVSLHRSEGTGLTISDAMALAKPVIATGWSGNMDFMTVANSFPVAYDMVELQENVGPYQAGVVWAEPSVAHAAELMRFVFDHRDEAAVRGQRAQRDIAENYSADAVATLIATRLKAIRTRRDLAVFRNKVFSNYRAYRRLPERLKQVVNQVAPADATLLVVSKGDETLLDLGPRRAWHFPRQEDGAYSGYYPADSAAAIAHLEDLRGRGAEFLLFPSSARWWLDHYEDFRRHLQRHYRAIAVPDDSCTIFALRPR